MGRARNRIAAAAVAGDQFEALLGARRGTHCEPDNVAARDPGPDARARAQQLRAPEARTELLGLLYTHRDSLHERPLLVQLRSELAASTARRAQDDDLRGITFALATMNVTSHKATSIVAASRANSPMHLFAEGRDLGNFFGPVRDVGRRTMCGKEIATLHNGKVVDRYRRVTRGSWLEGVGRPTRENERCAKCATYAVQFAETTEGRCENALLPDSYRESALEQMCVTLEEVLDQLDGPLTVEQFEYRAAEAAAYAELSAAAGVLFARGQNSIVGTLGPDQWRKLRSEVAGERDLFEDVFDGSTIALTEREWYFKLLEACRSDSEWQTKTLSSTSLHETVRSTAAEKLRALLPGA